MTYAHLKLQKEITVEFLRANWEIIDEEFGVDTVKNLLNDDVYTIHEYEQLLVEIDCFIRSKDSALISATKVYTKFDRILTGEDITVQIVTPEIPTQVSAWNDGKNISFNREIVKLLSEEDIPSLHGINYHEICHSLYTPRGGSEFVKWVIENDFMNAFNILEDQRIELLMTARFPSVRFFLEANALRYVMLESESADSFILIHGRKYMDFGIRQRITSMFVDNYGQKLAKSVADIIDEYIYLTFPDDNSLAKALIKRFADIVGTGNDMPKGNGSGGVPGQEMGDKQGDNSAGNNIKISSPCGGKDNPLTKGRATSGKAQEQDSKKAEQMFGNAPEVSLTGSNSDSGSGDDNNFDTTNNNIENEHQYSEADHKLADQINERIKKLKTNTHVAQEIQQFRESVYLNDEYNGTLGRSNTSKSSVMEDYRHASDEFARELERLELDNEQSWVREVPQGRLNVQRTMNSGINDLYRMFDRWEEADYSTEMEAVILVDCSSSMSGRVLHASHAVWSIKRGLQALNANTTVYSFNSNSRLMFSADEDTDPHVVPVLHTNGTTNPTGALTEAEQIFDMTSRSTKLLFIITDGGFDNSEPCDDVVKRLNDKGVITSTVFIGHIYEGFDDVESIEQYRHYAQFFNVITEPRHLVEIASDIVKAQIGARR
jgi:hypothetical protein